MFKRLNKKTTAVKMLCCKFYNYVKMPILNNTKYLKHPIMKLDNVQSHNYDPQAVLMLQV